MASEAEFKAATEKSRTLPSQSNESLLKMYSLFKQASVGDVAGKRPGMFDLKGRAKYDAWASLKGKSQDDARAEYVALIDSLAG